jgi:hypothetical protein
MREHILAPRHGIRKAALGSRSQAISQDLAYCSILVGSELVKTEPADILAYHSSQLGGQLRILDRFGESSEYPVEQPRRGRPTDCGRE